MLDESLAGRFLVATPVISLPPFARTVVLILEHDDTGAIGIILNHDTHIPVADVLEDLAGLATEPRTVFLGGPVSPDTAIALAHAPGGPFLRPTPLGTIGIVDPTDPPDDVKALRVYAGYSGWDPGQLEAEIEEGAWWIVLARVEDIFGDTAGLWTTTVRRAPGRVPLYSTYPDDPTAN